MACRSHWWGFSCLPGPLASMASVGSAGGGNGARAGGILLLRCLHRTCGGVCNVPPAPASSSLGPSAAAVASSHSPCRCSPDFGSKLLKKLKSFIRLASKEPRAGLFSVSLEELIPTLLYLALQTAFLQLRLESFRLLISQPQKFLAVRPNSLFLPVCFIIFPVKLQLILALPSRRAASCQQLPSPSLLLGGGFPKQPFLTPQKEHKLFFPLYTTFKPSSLKSIIPEQSHFT